MGGLQRDVPEPDPIGVEIHARLEQSHGRGMEVGVRADAFVARFTPQVIVTLIRSFLHFCGSKDISIKFYPPIFKSPAVSLAIAEGDSLSRQ